MSAHFKVVNWAARMPGRTSRAEWHAWAGGTEETIEAIAPAELPMMLRRRLTPIGQAALAVTAETDVATGLPERQDAAALVKGPTGLALAEWLCRTADRIDPA